MDPQSIDFGWGPRALSLDLENLESEKSSPTCMGKTKLI
jgi:hypothetical protein